MLAALTNSRTAMMLASDRLRVVLATTHIALRDVPAAVTPDALAWAARLTREGLRRWYGIAEPRIALCALNPHAGDDGRFGDEDDRILRPVARDEGMAGPFPADTVFVRAMRGEFDAVIAPYHDVGMTAIKVASFGQRGERHARAAVSAHVARSRHGDRHRGAGSRGCGIHDRGDRMRAVRTETQPTRRRTGLRALARSPSDTDSRLYLLSSASVSMRRPSIARTMNVAPPPRTRSPTSGSRPSAPKTYPPTVV